MASLLQMALEGSLGGIFGEIDLSMGANNSSGQPEASEGSPEKELIALKGPLGVQFAEALARVYDKRASDREDEAQTEEAQAAAQGEALATATESQANDALNLQELASNIQVMSEGEAPDNSTTVYGVAATDVKPEDIVEVSQEIDNWANDISDFVVVMDADLPSENGQGGGENAQPKISELGRALEAMCQAKGVRLYYSLEAFAQSRLKDDDEVLKTVMQHVHKHFDATMKPDHVFFPTNRETKAATTRSAMKLLAALEKHFEVKIPSEAHDKLKTPRKLAAHFKHATQTK